MIPGSKGYTFHACMKKCDFGIVKHVKIVSISLFFYKLQLVKTNE